MKLTTVAVFTFAALTFAGNANAVITFGPDFAGFYSDVSLGTPPGVPGPLGGLTLLAGDPNTLLIGGAANSASGAVYSVGLTRDIDGHITGFSNTASVFATAPGIDGGLAYAPNGTLMFTMYPAHRLGQIKPGSIAPDRDDAITGIGSSVGSLTFVPAGFSGAGSLKVVSYNTGQLGTLPIAPDGTGGYNIGTAPVEVSITGGPEGIAYVQGINDGFLVDSMLVAEYDAGSIGAYAIDATGNPIVGSRRVFLSGLSGAEGAFIDPITGDFLFSTFNSGNNLVVIRGFVPVPEPSCLAMGMITVFGAMLRRSRRDV